MKKIISLFFTCTLAAIHVNAQPRLITRTGHAAIYSHTIAEDITGNNYEVSGTINPSNGEVTISLPVQSFQFEKALMQEHFNSPQFMDSRQFPRITFKGTIVNAPTIEFSKNGKYEVAVSGNLTIKGTSKPISEKVIIEVNNGKVSVTNNFIVKDIGSYGVGKPKGSKRNNVADDIQINYSANYELENE
jgi:polyisoprenoid-binding protein YceI